MTNLYSVTLATGRRDDQIRVEPIAATNIHHAITAARDIISRPHAALIRWERFSAHTAKHTLSRHPEQIIYA